MYPDKNIDGTEFKGERLTVQFARGPRRKDDFSGPPDRNIPRPRRTIYRMQITGLQPDTSWQVRYPNMSISRLFSFGSKATKDW